MQNDIYYEKYLKYKAKYQALKAQQGGLLTLKNGVYAYFCAASVADQICASVHGTTPSNSKINEILEKSGDVYRGKNGDKQLVLVKESGYKKLEKKVSDKAKKVAHNAGVAIKNVAYKAAVATHAGLIHIKDKIVPKKDIIDLDSLETTEKSVDQTGGENAHKYIKLNTALSTNNDNELKSVGAKLKTINPSIDTVVVIDLKTVGHNRCLNKLSF